MGMFTENEILLMIGVVSVLLILITILTIFDIKDYLKNKKNGFIEEEFEPVKEETIKEEVLEPVEMVEVKENEEVLISDIDTNSVTEEYLSNTNNDEDIFIEEDEETQEALISEIEPIKVQVNEIKQEINLQDELNKALNEIPNEDDAIAKFEEEQERTAIISLNELMEKSNELYNNNEYVQYDDGNEPITIDEVIAKFNKEDVKEVSVPEVMENIVEERVEPYSKKETIPFISSVYGLEKDNQLEFENTATYEKLSRSTSNDFMTRLREINENK